ncbi:SGNH/GDSL hydrolase family protein [soil metagenome]
MARFWNLPPLLLLAGGLLAGCGEGRVTPPEQNLFERYVALGNSITAGVQSDGLNDSTQAQTYPVMLAQRANATFNYARLARPGCPPPLIGPIGLTTARVGGGSEASCAFYAQPIPQPVQNLSVPGFRIADALTVPGFPASLVYNPAFGARSLVQAMIDAKPTLVSVWLGNNDALSAGTSGDAGRLTTLAEFEGSLNAITAAIAEQTPARDAVLIGVIDPTLAPIVQPGAFFWAAKQDAATAGLLPKPVNANCAPGSPLATNLVSLRAIGDGGLSEISCANDAPYVLNASERQAITTRVGEFNALIRARAEARRWVYIDANAILSSALANPNQLRKCQGMGGASTGEQAIAVLRTTCPYPGAPNFFGALVSFDAIHPSAEGHRLIADAIAAALRAKHGISL